MSLDLFKIAEGLAIQLDDQSTESNLLTGLAVPGGDGSRQDAAPVGSAYLRTTPAGGAQLYVKATDTFNTSQDWMVLATEAYVNGSGQMLQLYKENAVAPTLPNALGVNSVAIGYGATAEADRSIALGEQAVARLPGALVQAGGRFASSGDAQVGRYLLRATTVNSSFTEMFINPINSTRLQLPDNSTWTFKGTVTGHRTDADDGHAGYEFSGVVYRGSGANTTNIQGTVTISVIAESNPAWDINITADSTNGSLRVSARGETGKQIRWLAFIETVEVTN